MRRRPTTSKETAEELAKDIRRKTRRQLSAEEKIRVVLEGQRGEVSITGFRQKVIATIPYGRRSKEVAKAGKSRRAGHPTRQATASEVKELRLASAALKEAVAGLVLENRLLKKGMFGDRKRDLVRHWSEENGQVTHQIPRLGEARDHPYR